MSSVFHIPIVVGLREAMKPEGVFFVMFVFSLVTKINPSSFRKGKEGMR